MVMQGMATIKDTRKDYSPFDSWLKTLGSVLDSRTKDDLFVAASEEMTSDISFTEHAVRKTRVHLI